MSYTYYFLSSQIPANLPAVEYTEVHAWRIPVWDCRLQCNVYGYAVTPCQLSQEDLETYRLAPKPENAQAAVRKG